MEFFRQLLITIDITYAAFCMVAIPVACYLLVMWLPVPMLFVFGSWCFAMFAVMVTVPAGDRARAAFRFIYSVAGVVLLYGWCAHVVISDGLCTDISGWIPGTMDSWMQSLVPHTCPAGN